MWEEQIAKAKTHSSKSPVEITLDEDPGDKRSVPAKEQKPAELMPQPKQNFVGMFPLMSALQVHPPPSLPRPKAAPSATITRPPSEEEMPPTLNVPTLPAKFPRLSLDAAVPPEKETTKKEILKVTDHSNSDEVSMTKLPVNETESAGDKEQIKLADIAREPKEPEMQSSVLKSILLEGGSCRKRSSLATPPEQKPAWPLHDSKPSSNDILRRRLLGIKDAAPMAPPPAATNPNWRKAPRPTFAPNNHLLIPTPPCSNQNFVSARSALSMTSSASRMSRLSIEANQQLQAPPKVENKDLSLSTASPPVSAKKELLEDKKTAKEDRQMEVAKPDDQQNSAVASKKPGCEEVLSRYTHTSVLKHLLNRYTGNSSSDQESSPNPK